MSSNLPQSNSSDVKDVGADMSPEEKEEEAKEEEKEPDSSGMYEEEEEEGKNDKQIPCTQELEQPVAHVSVGNRVFKERKQVKNPITIEQMRMGIVDPEVHSRYVNEIIHFLQWVGEVHPHWLTDYCHEKQNEAVLLVVPQEKIRARRKRIKDVYMDLVKNAPTNNVFFLDKFTPEGIMEFLALQANQYTGKRLTEGAYSSKRTAIKHLIRCQEGRYWDAEFEERLEFLWTGFSRLQQRQNEDDDDTDSNTESDNNCSGRSTKKRRRKTNGPEKKKKQKQQQWPLPDWILEQEEEMTNAATNTTTTAETTTTTQSTDERLSPSNLAEQVYKQVMENITAQLQGRSIIHTGDTATNATGATTTPFDPPLQQLSEGKIQDIINTSVQGPFKALGDQIKELISKIAEGAEPTAEDGDGQQQQQQQPQQEQQQQEEEEEEEEEEEVVEYPTYNHGGRSKQSRLPKDYEFPSAGLYDLWLKWNNGDSEQQTPPLRLLKASDYAFLNNGKDQKATNMICEIRFICKYIEEKAAAAGIKTNDRSPTNVRLMFETASSSLSDCGSDFYNGKPVKWSSYMRRLRKKVRREREARDAAARDASTAEASSAVAGNEGEKEDNSQSSQQQPAAVPPQMQQQLQPQQQQLPPQAGVGGGQQQQQLTEERFQQIIGASVEGPLKCLGDQIKELVSTRLSAQAQQHTDAEGYPYRYHDNHAASRLPEDYEFPRASVYDLWLKWNIGNKELQIPPLRNLLPQDYAFLDTKPKSDEMKKGSTGKYKDNRRRASKIYSDMRFVCKYIEEKAKAAGIDITDRSPRNVHLMFEAASSSLFEGGNPILMNGKEVKWATINTRLRRKFQEENKAAIVTGTEEVVE